MVSDPNFVFGIKQTSLANKEDSHVHTGIRSHTCLSAGSRLHNISQPPWLTALSRSSSLSNLCLSLSKLCTTSLHLMNQLDRLALRHIATKTQEPDLQR